MAQDAKEFRHQTPDFEGVKKTWHVCNTDLMKVQVQVVKNGGENNLHTHTGEDAFGTSSAVRSNSMAKAISSSASTRKAKVSLSRAALNTGSKAPRLNHWKSCA